MLSLSKTTLAKAGCIYSGLVFGIYWIPLRALSEYGFEGVWSTLLFTGIPALLVLPLFYWRRQVFLAVRWRFHLTCFLLGAAYALYASAFLYTEVVKVIALFYLLPIWGFLLARIFVAERITAVRWFSMLCALLGLWIILGMRPGIPWPNNIGDSMALIAGLTWAVGSLMLLTGEGETIDFTLGFLAWGAISTALLVLIALAVGYAVVSKASVFSVDLWWMLPFTIIVLLPASYAAVLGPSHLNPGIVGLLFMTEVSVATVTAALFANEPFGLKELIGVLLITIAGAAEPVSELIGKRNSISRA